MSWVDPIWLSFHVSPYGRKQANRNSSPRRYPTNSWDDRGFSTTKNYGPSLPWGCMSVINQELLQLVVDEGWLWFPKKNTWRICRVKKTNQRLSTLQKLPYKDSGTQKHPCSKTKKTEKFRHPELNSTCCLDCSNSQGLLHIVWAKCITSLKVWTITCLGFFAGGTHGSPWMCGTFSSAKHGYPWSWCGASSSHWKTCAGHVWDHLPKGTKS